MVQDPEMLAVDIKEAQDRFVAEVRPLITTEALGHAAKNMGMVFAGGCQAVKADLLPLTEDRLLKRIKRCFERSIIEPTRVPDITTEALTKLDQGLRAAVDGKDTQRLRKLIAIVQAESSDAVQFVVHAAKLFNTWFNGNEAARVAALRWLLDEGLLEVSDRGAVIREGFTTDSVRHIRRIQGKSRATIVFLDPRAKLKATLNKTGR